MNEIFKLDSGYFGAFVWFAWIGTGIVVAAAIGLEIARDKNVNRDNNETPP